MARDLGNWATEKEAASMSWADGVLSVCLSACPSLFSHLPTPAYIPLLANSYVRTIIGFWQTYIQLKQLGRAHFPRVKSQKGLGTRACTLKRFEEPRKHWVLLTRALVHREQPSLIATGVAKPSSAQSLKCRSYRPQLPHPRHLQPKTAPHELSTGIS